MARHVLAQSIGDMGHAGGAVVLLTVCLALSMYVTNDTVPNVIPKVLINISDTYMYGHLKKPSSIAKLKLI